MNDKKPYDIGDIFRQMELDLISNMRKVFSYHQKEESKEGFKWEQWQRAKLRAINEYRKRNSNIVNSYTDKIIKNVDEQLGRNYIQGENNFIGLGKRVLNKVKSFFGLKEDEIKIDSKIGIPVDTSEQQKVREYISNMRGQSPTIPEDNSFFKLNDKKLEALQEVVKNDLEKAQASVLRKMDDVYRQTIFKSQVYLQSGATTIYKAVDMATKDFLEKGIDSITYSNGTKVNIASYAEMCLRTANHRATLLGEGKKRDEFGVHLVVVSAHANTCEKCAPWQGKILIDDVFSHPSQEYIDLYNKKYPLLSEAVKAGLLHPNCRHSLITYFEGITKLPKVPDTEDAINTYKAEQKQREMEREIRKYKRIESGSCDEGAAKYAGDKIKQLEKELRGFLKLHPELRRANDREKVIV
ncbi:phage minor capsid protein [Clostridium saccharoperbutylacetonicum]|uniref:phage minor capsid protein n=1 Tax=Clostridium saccharoperbutylacetonicum TaxID=36745 RepID=UPI0039E8A737